MEGREDGNTRQTKEWVTRIADLTIPRDQRIQLYDDWAKDGTYDRIEACKDNFSHIDNLSDESFTYGTDKKNVSDPVHYKGPAFMCDVIADLVPVDARQTYRILDVAAGTGLLAQKLKDIGFCRLDALDPSPGMLEEARKKGVYQNFICDYITQKPLDIQESSCDCIAVVGGYATGHIPVEAFHEMVRIVRPGGYVTFIINECYLNEDPGYKDKLVPQADDLENQGKWKKVRHGICALYAFQNSGVYFVYEVLK